MADKLSAKIGDLGTSDDRDSRMRAHDLGMRRISLLVDAEHIDAAEEQTAQLRRIADALEGK
jgi:hypothetical protein